MGLKQLTIWASAASALSSQKATIARMLGASPDAIASIPIPSIPIPSIPIGVFVVFLLFFLLGFFFYAAAYAAVGSSCSFGPGDPAGGDAADTADRGGIVPDVPAAG